MQSWVCTVNPGLREEAQADDPIPVSRLQVWLERSCGEERAGEPLPEGRPARRRALKLLGITTAGTRRPYFRSPVILLPSLLIPVK